MGPVIARRLPDAIGLPKGASLTALWWYSTRPLSESSERRRSLALLRDTGLVCARGEGAHTYYSLDWQRFSEGLLNFISTVEEFHRHDRGSSSVCG